MIRKQCKWFVILSFLLLLLFVNHRNVFADELPKKLTVTCPNTITAYPNQEKEFKFNYYFDGVHINNCDYIDIDYTSIKFSGYNKKIISWINEGLDLNSDHHFNFPPRNFYTDTTICADEKFGKTTIKVSGSIRIHVTDYDDSDQMVTKEKTYSFTKNISFKVIPYKKLWVYACLWDYSTRSNMYTGIVKNYSNKTITIYSKGCRSYDDDYKKYDRKLKLKGNKKKIKIKPGQRKKIRYKVRGKRTWWNYKEAQICGYWKWGKKKYWVTYRWDEPPYRRSGNRWIKIGVCD